MRTLAGLPIMIPLLALLSACGNVPVFEAERKVSPGLEADSPESRRGVHADLIRGMVASKQYYAAIAHLEAHVADSGSTPELKLLEAEARRNLDQIERAQDLYRALLKEPPYVADAYYGLGLISARTNLATSTWQLQQAVDRRPANADMRNDLGYALMLSKRYSEALTQLATAVELDAGDGSAKARNNLVLLMMVTGDEPAVRRLAAESEMSEQMLQKLRSQAQAISRQAARKSRG